MIRISTLFFLQCLMKPCRGWMNCLQPVSGSVWITTMPPSSPTFTTPLSTLPVATVPLPVIENTSSTGIRNGLSCLLYTSFDWNFSPTHTSSEPLSQTPVRASTKFYLRFTLDMGRSHGFGSTACNLRPIQTRFPCGFAA